MEIDVNLGSALLLSKTESTTEHRYEVLLFIDLRNTDALFIFY